MKNEREIRFTVRLSPHERARLNEIAEREFNTPSGVLRRFINLGLKPQEISTVE